MTSEMPAFATPNALRLANSKAEVPKENIKHQRQTKQVCAICSEETAASQFKKFSACKNGLGKKSKCNKTCNFCWTRFLKIQLIEQPNVPIECFECNVPLDLVEVLIKQKLLPLREREHYEWKKRRLDRAANHERECTRVKQGVSGIPLSCRSSQPHDPAHDGRVFTCGSCGAQDCVPCNAPEHVGETCVDYEARMKQEHGAEELATTKAFQRGYEGLEQYGKQGKVGMKQKRPKPCPGCGIRIEREEKCPRMRCIACEMEFCLRCNAVYVGKGSVPELGNAAHDPGCTYYRREKEDKRFTKRKRSADEDAEVDIQDGPRKKLSAEDMVDSLLKVENGLE